MPAKHNRVCHDMPRIPSGGPRKLTRKMHRDINTTFNAGLVIEDVGSDDRLQFVVKDVCMLQESRVGYFGPKAAPPSGQRVEGKTTQN
jgi:hypothetical protein